MLEPQILATIVATDSGFETCRRTVEYLSRLEDVEKVDLVVVFPQRADLQPDEALLARFDQVKLVEAPTAAATAQLTAANPAERLFGRRGVRVLPIIDVQCPAASLECGVASLHRLITAGWRAHPLTPCRFSVFVNAISFAHGQRCQHRRGDLPPVSDTAKWLKSASRSMPGGRTLLADSERCPG